MTTPQILTRQRQTSIPRSTSGAGVLGEAEDRGQGVPGAQSQDSPPPPVSPAAFSHSLAAPVCLTLYDQVCRHRLDSLESSNRILSDSISSLPSHDDVRSLLAPITAQIRLLTLVLSLFVAAFFAYAFDLMPG